MTGFVVFALHHALTMRSKRNSVYPLLQSWNIQLYPSRIYDKITQNNFSSTTNRSMGLSTMLSIHYGSARAAPIKEDQKQIKPKIYTLIARKENTVEDTELLRAKSHKIPPRKPKTQNSLEGMGGQ